MPDQPTITAQTTDAFEDAQARCSARHGRGLRRCCNRAGLDAAAPHIAAQALRDAGSQAAGVAERLRGIDPNWSKADGVSRVVAMLHDRADELADTAAGGPGSVPPTRTTEPDDGGDSYGGTECEHGAPACDPPTPGCRDEEAEREWADA